MIQKIEEFFIVKATENTISNIGQGMLNVEVCPLMKTWRGLWFKT